MGAWRCDDFSSRVQLDIAIAQKEMPYLRSPIYRSFLCATETLLCQINIGNIK